MELYYLIWTQQVQKYCWQQNLGEIGSAGGQVYGPKHYRKSRARKSIKNEQCSKGNIQQQQL